MQCKSLAYSSDGIYMVVSAVLIANNLSIVELATIVHDTVIQGSCSPRISNRYATA